MNQLTHFLNIPLATSTSRCQLETSLRRAKTDPSSVYIHDQAFMEPDALHSRIAALSLPTPELCKQAVDFLKNLDIRSTIQEIRRSTVVKDGKAFDTEGINVKTLKTSLVGLKATPNLAETDSLFALLKDPDGIIGKLLMTLRQRFADRGFVLPAQENEEEQIRHRHMEVCIMSNRGLYTKDLSRRGRGYPNEGLLRFNVEDFFQTFKEHVWAGDFQLEKLKISRTGMCDILRSGRVVGRGWRDLVSVTLPEAPCNTSNGYLKGISYRKTPKTRNLKLNT